MTSSSSVSLEILKKRASTTLVLWLVFMGLGAIVIAASVPTALTYAGYSTGTSAMGFAYVGVAMLALSNIFFMIWLITSSAYRLADAVIQSK
jgi:hypothetical protein